MAKNLLNCPFCGGDMGNPRFVQNASDSAERLVAVMCWHAECGAQGAMYQTEAEAIAAWNRRVPRPETPDERQAAIVRALRADAHRCDCFAYSADECACGARGGEPDERSFKRKYVEDVADWIESGEWRK